MPLISFKCNACGDDFDAFRGLRIGTESGPPCPKCGAPDTVYAEDSLDDATCGVTVGAGTIR